MISDGELFKMAYKAAENSYSPYSHFAVGAALLTASGRVYTGCNIENASYPAGICAERCAMSRAVASGEKDFTAVAIASPDSEAPVYPCGICLQFMSEFMGDGRVVLRDGEQIISRSLKELMPFGFKLVK